MTNQEILDLITYFEQRANQTGEYEVYAEHIVNLCSLLEVKE